jgi:hypothetical protein
MSKLLALTVYAILLMPGFIQGTKNARGFS